MSARNKTKAELARKAGVTRPTFYKALKELLTDPEARRVLGKYKRRLGYTPEQVDYIARQLTFFNL